MPTRSTCTWIDDQRKDYIDPKIHKQRYRPKKLQTHNLPTDDVENINSTNKGKLYYSLRRRGLFPEEQKGRSKGSRGTAELLYIDQHILNESKTKRKNLTMAWIDCKKAYDMLSQRWIINCFKMYKISNGFIKVIEKNIKTWRVEVTTGGISLAEGKILRGIFQGDALSLLLFIITTMPLNAYSENTQPDTNLVDRKKRSIPKWTWMTLNYLQKIKKIWEL